MILKYFLFLILFLTIPTMALAVPDVVGVRVTDVTPTSFSLVWMTDVTADPSLELYADQGMTERLTDILITPMPKAPLEVASAAQEKGIMKVRVTGLTPATAYYVRAVTVDTNDPANISYSTIQEVTTSTEVVPCTLGVDGILYGFANSMVSWNAYLPASLAVNATGILLVLETPSSPYPVTAFVGAGSGAPEGVLDLNNLFSSTGLSLDIRGSEKAIIHVYRGEKEGLSTLLHYRRMPVETGAVTVAQPVTGVLLGDINLDGKVDDYDFSEFTMQYEEGKGTSKKSYNPDFNFDNDSGEKVDIADFARFVSQYGKSNAQ